MTNTQQTENPGRHHRMLNIHCEDVSSVQIKHSSSVPESVSLNVNASNVQLNPSNQYDIEGSLHIVLTNDSAQRSHQNVNNARNGSSSPTSFDFVLISALFGSQTAPSSSQGIQSKIDFGLSCVFVFAFICVAVVYLIK
jgi:hypothetical protein